MKISQEASTDVIRLGDIQENRVGIDVKNIDFIASLLTSNLYSFPFKSFLREIISNAYDSHVEAGTDKPIIMLIKDDRTISIRDYGVGISPERFELIYKNIGSSTRRDSNDFIGAFGIGRFAPLSCADNVLINSYYNGIKYSYLMYKNGTGINVDTIGQIPLEDCQQGVEVVIDYPVSESEFKDAVESLYFFDSLHIEAKDCRYAINSIVSTFKSRQIKNYGAFSSIIKGFISYTSNNYVRIGNVVYPVDNNIAGLEGFGHIFLNCEIGSIQVTPNREAIQYTPNTKKYIADKSLEAIQQIADICYKEACNKKSLTELATYLNHLYLPDTSYSRINTDAVLPLIKSKYNRFTINGKEVPSYVVNELSTILFFALDSCVFRALYKGSKEPGFSIGRGGIYIKDFIDSDIVIGITEEQKIREATKLYLSRGETSCLLVNKYNVRFIYRKLLWAFNRIPEGKKALRFILSTFKFVKVTNDMVPDEFIQGLKKKEIVVKSSNVKFRVYGYNGYTLYESGDSYRNISRYIKGLKGKWYIISENLKDDQVLKDLGQALCSKEIGVISYPKGTDVSKLMTKRAIKLEDFLIHKHNFLVKVFTANMLYEKYYNFYRNVRYSDYNKFMLYINKYNIRITSDTLQELKKVYISRGWLDYAALSTFSVCDDYKELENFKIWLHDASRNLNVATYLLLKHVNKRNMMRKIMKDSDIKEAINKLKSYDNIQKQ